jgi:hypothetical protein
VHVAVRRRRGKRRAGGSDFTARARGVLLARVAAFGASTLRRNVVRAAAILPRNCSRPPSPERPLCSPLLLVSCRQAVLCTRDSTGRNQGRRRVLRADMRRGDAARLLRRSSSLHTGHRTRWWEGRRRADAGVARRLSTTTRTDTACAAGAAATSLPDGEQVRAHTQHVLSVHEHGRGAHNAGPGAAQTQAAQHSRTRAPGAGPGAGASKPSASSAAMGTASSPAPDMTTRSAGHGPSARADGRSERAAATGATPSLFTYTPPPAIQGTLTPRRRAFGARAVRARLSPPPGRRRRPSAAASGRPLARVAPQTPFFAARA